MCSTRRLPFCTFWFEDVITVLFAELRRGAAAMNEALHAWLALVCLLVGIEIAYLGSYLGWRMSSSNRALSKRN